MWHCNLHTARLEIIYNITGTNRFGEKNIFWMFTKCECAAHIKFDKWQSLKPPRLLVPPSLPKKAAEEKEGKKTHASVILKFPDLI